MQRLIALSIFIFIVVLVAAVGSQFVGGEWYQAMHQPVFSPPAIVMASIWAVVYVLMAVAAWLVWDSKRGRGQIALSGWGLQLLLSIAWSWVFFGLHRVGWSLPVIGLWFLVVLITAKSFKSIRLEAGSLMLLAAGWLLFVLTLNFTQWLMNGGGLRSLM